MNQRLTYTEVAKLLTYKDGKLYWKTDRSTRVKAGDSAGHRDERYHCVIKVNSLPYSRTRLVWTMHHGEPANGLRVDHKDGDVRNDRIENLTVNAAKEPHIHIDDGRWSVQIKRKRYGKYATIEEAVAMRDKILAEK